ncbi:MAG: carboxypeptidase regulatory-like domain-containing protein, partial [Spirochaetales bacterium]|nr:carboxypeptidase regulatory-like domain-containing protein [Candidatus Physcosoma equi]
MRRRLFSIILSVLLVLAVFTSCEGEKLPSGFVTSPSLKGKVALPEGATVSPGDFYVQVIDTETEKVVYNDAVKEDGSFVVSNLDATRKYNVLLTTDPPYSSFKAVKSGYGGWLQDATASIGAANDVGSIKTKPLGTITGKAELSGETEHYDITVYIPGTSYDARTDKDGSFTISNVPQGTYRLRYTSDGYLARMKENVVLRSDDDITSPVASAGTTTLVRNEGTVTGYAFLSGAKEHTGINIKFEDKEGSGFEASTSSNGSYSVKLKPGLYNAIVSYPGYKPETYSGINVVAANTTVLDEFSLVANAGSIIGTLIDKDGHPLSGVNVLVRDGEGEHSYSSLSSLDGTYLVSGVLPGTYDVTFNGSAYATVIIRDVVVGMSTRMDLGSTTLQLGTGSLSGRVILE